MSVSRFKFVSPGVFVKEFDNSQLPAGAVGVGPTIIGRLERGPAMRPVRLGSMSDFVEIFGNPIAGKVSNDVWRDGNYAAPTYAAYAIQAWLRNTPSVNVIRLLGTQHTNATTNTEGEAGWKINDVNTSNAGGSYGLFMVNSGSTNLTGTLAAIWYLTTGSIALSGAVAGYTSTSQTVEGSNALVESDSNNEFKVVLYNGSGTQSFKTSFNFNIDSNKYIRDVFNTNPTLTNTVITTTDNLKSYWLGETFDRSVAEYVTNTGSNSVYAFIAPLTNGTEHAGKFSKGMNKAKTGWVFSQDLGFDTGSYSPASMTKLFRLVAIDSGEWESKNLKVSVVDVKGPRNPAYEQYGTFSIEIRKANDLDVMTQVVERFTGLNLNPASENYIARRIGDRFIEWNDGEKRYREFGNYPNLSRYLYVQMNQDVENGAVDPKVLPFGYYGPVRFNSFTIAGSGSTTTPANSFVKAVGAKNAAPTSSFLKVTGSLSTGLDATFLFPSTAVRQSASAENLSDYTRAYFGFDVSTKAAKTVVDKSYSDYLKMAPSAYTTEDTSSNRSYSYYFTLDDLSGSSTDGATYAAGNRAAGRSITGNGYVSSLTGVTSSAGYQAVLDAGFNKFTMPLVGGFDGVRITEADPFNNQELASGNELTNYATYTLRRAVDTVADPERIVTDLIAIPGVTNTGITDHVIATAENRADCMAIIDLPNVYTPDAEALVTTSNRLGIGVDRVANALKARSINSSYAATYYPWVQIRDTINNQNVWVPPSVVALGALSYGQAAQELWFAPAGFTRGGLSEGRGGIPVLAVSQRLNSRERDLLYEANINPIAQFPAEGIVIFGQKTLQVTPSALDRINVRRLMIYLKREISVIASRLLFDQNVSSTWARFKGQVEPLLESVKVRLGITDYRLVLDTTTTTPDLIDRNIMYARIYLKPARAIEFIAIDFNISSSGASFAD
jgi:hypothetical protein